VRHFRSKRSSAASAAMPSTTTVERIDRGKSAGLHARPIFL
jgi:hypothetical protein